MDKSKDNNTKRIWYQTALRTSIVAGVFSIIVSVLILINYFQIKGSDPLNSPRLEKLKIKLLQEPKNEQLKEQIRLLDLELRKEYFRRRDFSKKGSYLLIGGIIVFLVSISYTVAYKKELPMPSPETETQEQKVRTAKIARWSVTFLSLLIGIAALVIIIISKFGSTGKFLTAIKQIKEPTKAEYPSQEEINENWHRFRGPNGLGISAYTNVPSNWNGETGEGILWKTPIPLPGENSAIVWEEYVFLTGATEDKREVYCFDGDSGDMLWQKPVKDIPGSPLEPPEVMEDTGFAAPTAVTDGQRVYAMFANGDIICLNFDGNKVWAKNLGKPQNMYGHSSSLTMYHNLVIVLFDQGIGAEDGLSELLALDSLSGQTAWRTKRPVPNSWASPIIIDTGERQEIITCGNPWVIAYNPDTGQEFWRANCLGGDVAPSPVFADGLVFAVNDYSNLAAIKPGGNGDVTDTYIVWTSDYNLPDICSPLSNGELLFTLLTYGILTCYDAKDGTVIWEKDFETSFQSSPSLVGEKIYLMSEEGTMFIVQADREFKSLGKAELGEPSNTCPAFLDGRIYIRGKKNLYCIARQD